MHDERKPKGLKLRGAIWWIDKTVRIGPERVQLRESTGCRALAEARGVLERREEEIRRAGGAVTPAEERGYRTFAEAAAEYIADLERRGKDSRRQLYALRGIMDDIGDLPLEHIHQRTIQPWIDRQEGVLASGTVGRTLKTIATVLRYAAEVLRDGHQPWLQIAPPRLRCPDWGTRKPRPITWEEQDRLLDALPDHLIPPVLFAVGTGARMMEVITMRWDQHREYPGMAPWSVWWIPPEIRKGDSHKRASEQDGRYLVCNRAVRLVLERQQGKHAEWVFPSPAPTGPGRLVQINNTGWRSATKEAGLSIRVHDLRHTFGERAANAGIPLDIRRSLLGHAHRDITLHYSSPGLARLLEESEKIERPGEKPHIVRKAV